VTRARSRALDNAPRAVNALADSRTRNAGAAGGIGQPLSLLLKLSPRIHTLNLYDVVNTAGVKADISHINTGAKVRHRAARKPRRRWRPRRPLAGGRPQRSARALTRS
jgi:hypothetical protein